MKRSIKQLVGFLLSLVLPLLLFNRKGQVLILSYHRILPKSHPEYNTMQPGMVVSDETFRKHILWLKKYINIIRLVNLKSYFNENRSSACVITLDDGWVDNYNYAFPILKELNVPATIFLVPNMIGTDNYFWPEKLGLLLSNSALKEILIKNIQKYCKTEIQNYEDYDGLINFLKSKSDQDIIEILDKVENEAGKLKLEIATNRQVLNEKELIEMTKSGLVDYGSHTSNHIRLDKVPVAVAKQEITDSKRQLEAFLNSNISTFCYPNGNYTTEVVETVSGIYELACTTDKGWANSNSNPSKLKRIMIHDDISNTKSLFWGRVLGVF